ncbi:glycosyltransferase family 2 protein [Flavobacterium sp. 11]|uniref:glycosyltransferase family 2 protein n=1 Tax=Flavobacterium sp. 11 TaxID=357523 RepID=UPI000C3A88A1|nr:glycosyltransferase family 2 protein [Flavobacterium sp. 11]PIF60603.1 glycosyltransferase involved in cell wall biosynthesis [Flavobacterium sp. 11]
MIFPKVTIIMATYNRAHFILETLQSIQIQTFEDWECLIIDDGGTDNTKEVITPILEKDFRFHYFKRTDSYLKGPGCRNMGLDLAKGDYIIFFDDDDIPHPQNLELCVHELSGNDISFCRYMRNVFFDDFDYNFDYSKTYTSFYIDQNDIEKILKNELQFICTSVMWKKECFKNNRFAEQLMYAEEWELYSRIVSSGLRGISIDKCLFYGRKHSNSLTGAFNCREKVTRKSYAEAILLVVKNLKEKQLLSYSLKRYFIAFSLDFKEFNLYEKILGVLELPKFERFKWQFFYTALPLRLKLYHTMKRFKIKSI